jgi:hypothetical protein
MDGIMKKLKSIRIDEALITAINDMAARERRTFSNQVECLLESAIKKPAAKTPTGVKKSAPTTRFNLCLPDWLNMATWEEFEDHRRDIKKPLTDLARTKLLNKLASLSKEEQDECIANSIASGWAGLFPNKLNGGVNGKPKSAYQQRVEAGDDRSFNIATDF